VEWIPLAAVALGAALAWVSRRKRISTAAEIEDSGRGDSHESNDDDCPMGGRGLGIQQSGSYQLALFFAGTIS
jgi:hypothetical protein